MNAPLPVATRGPGFLEPTSTFKFSSANDGTELYGEWFRPYPYPSLTIDGLPIGLGGGMEYPMLVMNTWRTLIAGLRFQITCMISHSPGESFATCFGIRKYLLSFWYYSYLYSRL